MKDKDITTPYMENNETWNDCPECLKNWKDKQPTPGLLHRTRLCITCLNRRIDGSNQKGRR